MTESARVWTATSTGTATSTAIATLASTPTPRPTRGQEKGVLTPTKAALVRKVEVGTQTTSPDNLEELLRY
ncbi:MAG: hypothetical protein V3S14_06160 [Anaerolineae bacterium]